MAHIQIGIGVILVALSSLGFLTRPEAGWVLLFLGVSILLFGLFSLGVRIRFPIYRYDKKEKSNPTSDAANHRPAIVRSAGALRNVIFRRNRVEGNADFIVAGEISDSDVSDNVRHQNIDPLKGVLRTMMNGDVENLQRYFRIRQEDIDWSGTTRKIGSRFIDFNFVITSSSVWDASLIGNLRGKLFYALPRSSELGEIRQDPELRLSGQVLNLPRTVDGEFTIRQYLPTEVHSDLVGASAEETTFIFEYISLDVALKNPVDGAVAHIGAVKLPPTWVTMIPAIAF